MSASTDTAVESTMLTWVDPVTNKNRFYEVVLAADSTVQTRYGRVGEPGTSRTSGRGRNDYLKVIGSKKRKGYRETAIASSGGSGGSGSEALRKEETGRRARLELAGNTTDRRLAAFIDRIVAANAHQIAAISGGKITVRDGQVTTPLGLLTLGAVADAARVLDQLAADPKDPTLLADYLTLVPQSVGRVGSGPSRSSPGTAPSISRGSSSTSCARASSRPGSRNRPPTTRRRRARRARGRSPTS